MLSRAQNTFHHNPRLRGPVSSFIRDNEFVLRPSVLLSIPSQFRYDFLYATQLFPPVIILAAS